MADSISTTVPSISSNASGKQKVTAGELYQKTITYDRETRDYAMYLDGELVGFARTHHEAETTLDALVYELLKSGTGIDAADAQRFWDKVEQGGDCWNWQASTNGAYGQFYFNGDNIHTHRFSYMLHFGAIPEGLIVRHKCDNPLCVKPDHLELGTYADNTADMMDRGRSSYVAHPGEANGKAKLSSEQVESIRNNYSGRYGEQADLARQYNVSKVTISKILRGLSWSSADAA